MHIAQGILRLGDQQLDLLFHDCFICDRDVFSLRGYFELSTLTHYLTMGIFLS